MMEAGMATESQACDAVPDGADDKDPRQGTGDARSGRRRMESVNGLFKKVCKRCGLEISYGKDDESLAKCGKCASFFHSKCILQERDSSEMEGGGNGGFACCFCYQQGEKTRSEKAGGDEASKKLRRVFIDQITMSLIKRLNLPIPYESENHMEDEKKLEGEKSEEMNVKEVEVVEVIDDDDEEEEEKGREAEEKESDSWKNLDLKVEEELDGIKKEMASESIPPSTNNAATENSNRRGSTGEKEAEKVEKEVVVVEEEEKKEGGFKGDKENGEPIVTQGKEEIKCEKFPKRTREENVESTRYKILKILNSSEFKFGAILSLIDSDSDDADELGENKRENGRRLIRDECNQENEKYKRDGIKEDEGRERGKNRVTRQTCKHIMKGIQMLDVVSNKEKQPDHPFEFDDTFDENHLKNSHRGKLKTSRDGNDEQQGATGGAKYDRKGEKIKDANEHRNEELISNRSMIVRENSVVPCQSQRPTNSKKRVVWSIEEEDTIREGISMFGFRWKEILNFGKGKFNPKRTAIDIKDKYRNMTKHASTNR